MVKFSKFMDHCKAGRQLVISQPEILVRKSPLAERGRQVMLTLNMIEIPKDRWLVALIALLLSAFVLAEQSDELATYDDLMKDTIYGGAGRWRNNPTSADDDWRSADPEELSLDYGAANNPDGEQNSNYERDKFNFENAEQGYRLFKIEI